MINFDWINQLNKNTQMRILWQLLFFYSLIVGLLVQIWVAPHFLGQPEGLFSPDAIGFNEIAQLKAKEIERMGWGAWELRPDNQFPAGMASFLYAMIYPSPLIMLPLNAAVHATSGYLVIKILKCFFRMKAAVIGGVFFVLNPISLEWITQIHRDGFYILGNIIFFYAFISIINAINDNILDVKNYCIIFLLYTFSILLVWVSRPYWIAIFLIFSILILGALIYKLIRLKNNNYKGIILLLGIIIIQYGTIKINPDKELVRIPASIEVMQTTREKYTEKKKSINEEIKQEQVLSKDENRDNIFYWESQQWLPKSIDNRLYTIGILRDGVIKSGGNTLIDSNRQFHSYTDLIEYLPRAFFVGFFSPFPEMWSGKGSSVATTIGRKLLGVISIVCYLGIFGSFIFFIRNIRNISAVYLLLLNSISIIIFTLICPNIGTLMRFRYAFYSLIISFGFSYISSIILLKRSDIG